MTFRRSGGLPPQARQALPGRGMFALTWRVHCRRPAAGGKRGRDTKVSLPLLTPQPFLRTRLPSVARLNARGPQGRLVLQEHALDRGGAFRSRKLPPCTEWPRTDSAADHARKIQGITASQNLPDARNRAPVTPVSLHISDMSAQRKVWGVKRGQETIGVLSPFAPAGGHRRLRRQTAAFPPVNTGSPGRRRRPLCTLTLSVNLASSGAPLYRRKVYRQLTVKRIFIYPSAEGCSE